MARLFQSDRYLYAFLTFVTLAACTTVLLLGGTPVPQEEYDHHGVAKRLPDQIFFNAHIRPIMSNTCFACHGPDEKVNESGMRLDSFTAAVDEGGAIEPGNAANSPVYERLMDADDPMPPAEFRHQLSDYEKALFKKWIDQGAEYEKHWAYAAIRRPETPTVKRFADRVANSIDAFVLSQLEMEGIEPTPLADSATLLRRLSLDLIGLPPTPAELQTFLADDSPDAWEKQVDRLLASPRYGENMAPAWLDLVRFSDTVGFHGDQNQRIFPFRDYVINSINANQPFDEFTREQLAGDLLDDPTDQQLVATGLIRLNMMTREGGAQPGEYLAKYTADRVRMIGTAWLGATTGCCECHNHKYDPFTSRDFYSLGAFFDDVQQWGVYHDYGYTPNPDLKGFSNDHPFPPELRVTSPSLNSQISYLERKLDQAAADLVPQDTLNTEPFRKWYDQLLSQFHSNGGLWCVLLPENVKSRIKEKTQTSSDGNILFPESKKEGQKFEVLLGTPRPMLIRSLKLSVLPSEHLKGQIGRSKDGHFSASLSITHQPRVDRSVNDPIKMIPVAPRFVRVELPGRKILSLAEVEVLTAGNESGEAFNVATAGKATQSSVDQGGDATRANDGNTSGNYSDRSTTHTKNENNPWWELDLGQETSITKITIWNRTDGNHSARLKGLRVVLLDKNRRLLVSITPELPSPSIDIDVPPEVSEFDLLTPAKISFVQADRFQTNRYSNGRPSPYVQGVWQSGPARWQLPHNESYFPHTAIFHLNEPILMNREDRLLIKLNSNDVGRVRFAVSPLARPVVDTWAIDKGLLTGLQSVLTSASVKTANPTSLTSLKSAYYQYLTPIEKQSSDVKRLRDAIAECRSGLALTMISQPVGPEQIRQSRVLPRGNWQDETGEPVFANTPHFLIGYTAEPEQRLTRLDLANWLTSGENPLTARHYVNRTWKHFFGSGLSNVLDDLGNQGEWPSHPELLDWLASEFQRDWDRKHIARLIVMSTTYQQQAAVRTDLKDRDPYNRLLAQQSARRLEAEAIRDNALAISGLLLDDWVGGPSVFPYQPPGYYANLQFPNRQYAEDTNGLQYRRGVYMHWQRTFLHPMLANFDAPSRDECTAVRTSSNSPQQALTLLNDPVFVEASRAFAARLLREQPTAEFAERLEFAFLIALARQPSANESDSLAKLYLQQLDYFMANPDEVVAFHQTGRLQVDETDAAELAALSQVCRVILNLHETITRY